MEAVSPGVERPGVIKYAKTSRSLYMALCFVLGVSFVILGIVNLVDELGCQRATRVQVNMPSYLPGIFVIVAGVAMMIGRKPLSLMQYGALQQARVVRTDRDKTLSRLRRIIVGGSALFIVIGST